MNKLSIFILLPMFMAIFTGCPGEETTKPPTQKTTEPSTTATKTKTTQQTTTATKPPKTIPSVKTQPGPGIVNALTFQPQSLDFGKVIKGQPIKPMDLTITNPNAQGAEDVTFTSSSNLFTIPNANKCQKFAKDCPVQIVFQPIAAGNINENITIAYKIDGKAQAALQIPVSAEVEAAPEDTLGVTGADFKTVKVEKNKDLTLTLNVTNFYKTDVSNIKISDPTTSGLAVNPDPAVSTCYDITKPLLPNATCAIVFLTKMTSPKRVVNEKRIITFDTAGAPGKDVEITLTGTIQSTPPAPVGSLEITKNNFGTIGAETNKEVTVTIDLKNLYNRGAKDIKIDAIGDFKYKSNNCGVQLGPNAQCEMVLAATFANVGDVDVADDRTITFTVGTTKFDAKFKLEGKVEVKAAVGLEADLATVLKSPEKENEFNIYMGQYKPVGDGPVFANKIFNVDKDGNLFSEDEVTKLNKQFLDIEFNFANNRDDRAYEIFDQKTPPNRLYTIKTGDKDFAAFDRLARVVRESGIYSLKNLNRKCYYAFAENRLKDKGDKLYERLYALDRPNDPRPLAFKDDPQWNQFKAEMKNAFAPFKGPGEAQIVIKGTATTFISRNPEKGKNWILFKTPKSAPKTCIELAKDPSETYKAYAFDTVLPANMYKLAGGPFDDEPSDIDVHVFIPALSKLCEDQDKTNKNKTGTKFQPANDGLRKAYYDTRWNDCFQYSPDKAIKDMALPNSDLHKFLDKWQNELATTWKGKANTPRKIGISVHILPNMMKNPSSPDDNFKNDFDVVNSNFVIDINK